MARLARVVAAGIPHHVTQRGNRRQQVFFGDEDYQAYRRLLGEGCRAAGVAVWAYCLMPTSISSSCPRMRMVCAPQARPQAEAS
jgi:putative transposase